MTIKAGLPHLGLIEALSRELAARYDFVDDGTGLFQPSDALVFLVGRVDDEPIACGCLVAMDDLACELKRMYVDPRFRGRGYSRLMLNALEEQARRLGYGLIRLETGDAQPEALALYRRSGYRAIPRYGPYLDNARSCCFEKPLV